MSRTEMKPTWYAMYRGDTFIDLGTADYLAEKYHKKKLDPLLEQASIAFLEDSEHFSYLVNHVLAKLENMSFTELTYLKDEVNEIIKEDMEC